MSTNLRIIKILEDKYTFHSCIFLSIYKKIRIKTKLNKKQIKKKQIKKKPQTAFNAAHL